MVKLIACDLDGTLLLPDRTLPKNTFEVIEKLYKKGIIFAPASGRQLPNLIEFFAPVSDKIAIIAENGGLAWADGKIFFSRPTPAADVLHALDVLEGKAGLHPLLSCCDVACYQDDYPPFVAITKKCYSHTARVSSLKKAAQELPVFKISVWDEERSDMHGGVILPPLLEGLRVRVSGEEWLDICSQGVSKGAALCELAAYFNVEREHIAAFGDHMNDLELLASCGQPFAPANAYPLLFESVKGCVKIASNADCGVIKKLEEWI